MAFAEERVGVDMPSTGSSVLAEDEESDEDDEDDGADGEDEVEAEEEEEDKEPDEAEGRDPRGLFEATKDELVDLSFSVASSAGSGNAAS